MKNFIAISLLSVLLVACGSKNESPAALESAREVASANAKFNAIKWRGENGFESLTVLSRGDSTQQPNCPQGDGWASVDLLDAATKQPKVKLKCSTYSSNVSCSTEADFKARPVLATQENTCSSQVPYPIKKLEN